MKITDKMRLEFLLKGHGRRVQGGAGWFYVATNEKMGVIPYPTGLHRTKRQAIDAAIRATRKPAPASGGKEAK